MLVTLINSEIIAAQEITLKYLEAGNTFMAADSVHHGVELQMKENHSYLFIYLSFRNHSVITII